MRFFLLLLVLVGCSSPTEPTPDYWKIELEIRELESGVLFFHAKATPPDTIFAEVEWSGEYASGGLYLVVEPRADITHIVGYPPEEALMFYFSAWSPHVAPDTVSFENKGRLGNGS